MTEKELIGVRDPFGFRPLCLGRTGDGLGAGQRNLRVWI
jgi:glutamine phosphoribosylpyrophosphate amidotransferase